MEAWRDQVHDEVSQWVGPGLLTVEGVDWQRQKRFLQPVFTRTAVAGYTDLVVDDIETVASRQWVRRELERSRAAVTTTTAPCRGHWAGTHCNSLLRCQVCTLLRDRFAG
jgi:cytochrome P450